MKQPLAMLEVAAVNDNLKLTWGLKSNGTKTYAKAPYFQMASDSLSIL